MVRGLYTATNGMITQQKKMDIIANNLANVNTTGFKKDGVVIEAFGDVLIKKVNDPSMVGDQTIGRISPGAKIGKVYTDFSQGSVMQTHDPLNIALSGKGMIGVGIVDDEGNITQRFTRNGSLILSNDGTLLTKNGEHVLGENGKIVLPKGNIAISEEGRITVNNMYMDKLKVVDFENPETLRKIGDSLYAKTEATVEKAFDSSVLQGFLETSNVNTVSEMVEMINVMRTYQANQKVIQTQDETLGKAVSQLGRV